MYRNSHLESQKKIIKVLTEKKELSEKLLSVRQRISMDIHDDVLGGLSAIRISSEMVKGAPPEVVDAFT